MLSFTDLIPREEENNKCYLKYGFGYLLIFSQCLIYTEY